ncbi:hypothetical protein GCK72_006516 [Caenorhabditis remanei]|uniref:Uncharacterized protein n=1 Tax=Caenorhabditis remanei TaxID=31234 RepID=A0A6A5HGX3_CAERE|nr:hypothetical protein GCK72_006516 [Caenorhabditis remanei]KAF1766559.1 hypothetical protein GCK72_006516 [Caenorhabditis remanei]
MILVAFFSLLITISSAAITTAPPNGEVECDIVPVTPCPVTCGGGFQLSKYVCVDKTETCGCPKNPIYYQCNNRPCLGKNPTLLDTFYDEENKQQEENGVEYVEDSGEAAKPEEKKSA